MFKKKRIFIKNLPETLTASELETTFTDYGKVINVDVKERKNFDSVCHQSRNFAYINLEIDEFNLQKCFKDFQNNLWHGQYVELQLAKESFLEQLKREREESNQKNANESYNNANATHDFNNKNEIKPLKIAEENRVIQVSDNFVKHNSKIKIDKPTKKAVNATVEDTNTNVAANHNENFTSNDQKLTPSEIKRAQSVNQMIKNYREQKLMIKTALLNVDTKVNNKIKFTDNDEVSNEEHKRTESNEGKKNALFESDEESENEFNFDVKETFTGKEGRKLLEMQSRYKNDKRFLLDERFIEDETVEDEVGNSEIPETTLEDEKKKQFEILEQVLGDTVKTKKYNEQESSRRAMLRYDPTQSDHLKYEIRNTETTTKEKKKRGTHKKENVSKENENEEMKQPNVSKEVFYKISDDLKDTFQKQHSFSLLNSFGNVEETEHREEEEEQPKEIAKKIKLGPDINPFKYDSSDDENEEFQKKDDVVNDKTSKHTNSPKFWTEPFFFRDDDYRFQEGVDFIRRLASEKRDEFVQLRRDLKNIVKAKVKNNQKRNRPFKKKLGGNKRKKMLRMKKAIKR